MEVKQFLNAIGVEPTKELLNNPKIKQLVEFIAANRYDTLYSEGEISPIAFEYLVNNSNSLENVSCILCDPVLSFILSSEYEELVKFYNTYDYKKTSWFGHKTMILVDDEYLAYATKEWTQDVLFKSNKIIKLRKDRVIFENNPYEKDDYNYIDPIEINLITLLKAKQEGRLKEVITKATKSM